ncbi:MAG: DUF3500 domain-containing protein [Vicinamibacteria bacterium]
MKHRLFLGALSIVAALAWAQPEDEAAKDMAEGAGQFLRSLTPELKGQASLPFEGDERFNWHYIPRDRKGLSYKAMTPAQSKLADSLMATGLSHAGMRKALDIMYLDQILFEREQRAIRDPELYFISIFGEPGSAGPWGWRVEGHHLSLNFTLEDGRVVSTSPAFLGANPAIVKGGAQDGMRVLASEEILGREFLHTFAEKDRVRVLIEAEAPRDIVTESSRRAEIGKPAGVAYARMSPDQKKAVVQIVGFYANRMRPDIAEVEMKRIQEAGLEQIHFAWAGGANPGDPHYYRLHGPTFLIEYDNTQNEANHIHTVWRDLEDDFGGVDVLADHYARSPHHQHQDVPHGHRHAEE